MKPSNLFIIGAPKSGTTALVEQLSFHPEVYASEKKEPRFFDAETFYDFQEDCPIQELNDYNKLYSSSEAQAAKYRIDGSVFNMYSPDSIKSILDYSPNSKFIAVLRDPVSASKSMHIQRLKYIDPALRELSEDFCECWELLKKRSQGEGFPKGCRNKFLFRYDLLYRFELYLPFLLELIDSKKIIFIDYATFRKSPESIHEAICRFLSIELVKLPMLESNPSYISKPTKFDVVKKKLSQQLGPTLGKIGITQRRFPIIKRLLSTSQKIAVRPSDTSCDSEVADFFADSIRAKDEICAKFDFNLEKS